MRFMIAVKATKDSEAGKKPEEKLFAAIATYHEELAKAGVLLYSGEKRTVIDGHSPRPKSSSLATPSSR